MISKISGSQLLKRLGWAVLLSSSVTFIVMADGEHEQGNDNKAANSIQATQHGSMEGGATHAHKEWTDPPAEYADKRNDDWADLDSIARGKVLYERNCAMCHGLNGRGTGPMAATLKHPPADLTNHFHQAPGKGDAYLFWRISEGGFVEPFMSMGSVMPPFKNMLGEDERWDTLAYVHSFFHLGLAKWSSDTETASSPDAGKKAGESDHDTMSMPDHGAH